MAGAKIGDMDLRFSSGDFSYAVRFPDPSSELLYRLADKQGKFAQCRFNIPHSEQMTDKVPHFLYGLFFEDTSVTLTDRFGSHLFMQVNNQIRFGMHSNYDARARQRLLQWAAGVFIGGVALFFSKGMMSFVLAGIYFVLSGVFAVCWACDARKKQICLRACFLVLY